MTGIRRLAQQLNVSSGTVSRALNGKPDVNEETRKRVLQAAAGFHHYGVEVVGAVPVAMHGDDIAIRTFAQRIERLCDVRLVDFLKEQL